MNDTNISPRQNYILNLISQSSGLKQTDLITRLYPNYKASKVTLLRDLKVLEINKLIKTSGSTKSKLYLPYSSHPLLHPFDMDRYFSISPDQRSGAKHSFNFEIIQHLHNLLLPHEKKNITENHISISKYLTTMDPTICKRELERFCVELSWKSSEIEGNTYSVFETEALLLGGTVAKDKTEAETQMIINHKTAFDTILENKSEFKVLKSSTILELHNLLAYKLGISTGIRTHAVGITGTTYLPIDNSHQLKEFFDQIIALINATTHPFEKALIAGAMIPYLQVFGDGNKRTGRMLTNAILLAHDYFPLSYRSVDKDEFKKSLILFYEQNSILEFKKILLDQLAFSHNHYFRT